MIKRAKVWIKGVLPYIVGKTRHFIYYCNPREWMRSHIREQIEYRIKVMNPTCRISGSCVKCGCETPALQMANKNCEGECYPPMMSRKKWNKFKNEEKVTVKSDDWEDLKLVKDNGVVRIHGKVSVLYKNEKKIRTSVKSELGEKTYRYWTDS